MFCPVYTMVLLFFDKNIRQVCVFVLLSNKGILHGKYC